MATVVKAVPSHSTLLNLSKEKKEDIFELTITVGHWVSTFNHFTPCSEEMTKDSFNNIHVVFKA
jgi:hypothetical protein